MKMPSKSTKKKSASKKKKKKPAITKKMNISKVVSRYPDTADIFIMHGLFCVGCSSAAFETIEQGAKAHGINPGALVNDLNKIIRGEKPDILKDNEEEIPRPRERDAAEAPEQEPKKPWWKRIFRI